MLFLIFNYLSFGYIPSGNFLKDILGKFRGEPNMFKRLQAKKILSYFKNIPKSKVLDFGCGSGYFSYEIAKLGHDVYAVDINSINIEFSKKYFPNSFGELKFKTLNLDQPLPFSDAYFDVIFLSEVIICLKNPELELKKLAKALNKNGFLIISNTLGRINIRNAYEKTFHFCLTLSRCILKKKFPKNYIEFCKLFFEADNLKKTNWFSQDELSCLLIKSGFYIKSIKYPYGKTSFNLLEWYQFIKISKGNGLQIPFSIFVYIFFEFLNFFSLKRDRANLIIIAKLA